MLLLLDAGVEGGGGIVVEDGDGGLSDDGPGVHAGVDEMDGAAGDFDAMGEGLFPRADAGERGEERGMDVDDALREGREHAVFDDAHEASENDIIGLCGAQGVYVGLFGWAFEFRFEVSGGDVGAGNAEGAGVVEDARGFDIGEHKSNFDITQGAALDGTCNGDEVSA